MPSEREVAISSHLADERGKRVAFVSHCLLNENARSPGGAFHSWAVPEIIELQRRGIGIQQMSCPVAALDRETINERAVEQCTAAGEGLFIRSLRQELARRGVDVPFLEYDLLAEMQGRPQTSLRVLEGQGANLATSPGPR